MFTAILNKIRKKLSLGGNLKRVSGLTVSVLILCTLTYLTYDRYRDTVVTQQQQQMLGIAKSIARSIKLFTDDIIDSLNVIALDNEFARDISNNEKGMSNGAYLEKLKAYYEAQGETVSSIYFLDESGKVAAQYPLDSTDIKNNNNEDIQKAIANKKTHIGKPYLDKSNSFVFNIYEPVYDESTFKGLISVAIKLDVIYDKLLAPVKIGEKGYAVVKDQDGIIIMHQIKGQIGINVIDTRKQLHPNLEFEELEDLINHQLKGEEGVTIYHSYWWWESKLEKAKKLNAYTPVQFGDFFWVVSVTMSYDEIQGPINLFLIIIIAIAGLITFIIFSFVSALFRMKRNKEELEKETSYLRMLNEASEQLRKKEAELYHSHKLKMIGTLAGGIAHDMNNLLTPILGYSELLLMTMPKDSEYYQDVEEISKASQKGKDLIEQILVFSRNDGGIVKVEPIDINKVTDETLKLIKAVLPKKIAIKENLDRDCGYVNANFTQLHQVIFNLCTNAYQSIKGKEGEVEISLRKVASGEINDNNKLELKDTDYAELVIKDNGCGMSEETKQRIFDPFFTTKGVGEGTGLGLFVVQSIIEKYNGTIFVESEPGVGSSFKVYLPLLDTNSDSEKGIEDESFISNGKSVLVVDDNEEVTKVIKKGLEHLGYRVVIETDPTKALRAFKRKATKFDVVITDYMMPKLKGGDLAKAIKDISKNTGVILMTGYMDEKDFNLDEMEAVDGFILKPVELAKLAKLTQEISDKFS